MQRSIDKGFTHKHKPILSSPEDFKPVWEYVESYHILRDQCSQIGSVIYIFLIYRTVVTINIKWTSPYHLGC